MRKLFETSSQTRKSPDLTSLPSSTKTSQDIRLAIYKFLRNRDVDDLILVYVTCHGLLDHHRRLYFAATDTQKNRLSATAIDSRLLAESMEECRARRQIIILDCCFSGTFVWGAKGDTDLDLNRRFHGGGRGKVLLTASRSTEYSFEGEAVHDETGGASIFTTSLIDGIKSGAADSDRDGFIYVPDAYYYAFDQMRAIYARETPQMEINDSGRGILLARNPIGMKISPAVLRDLITGPLSSKSPALLTAEGDRPTGQDMLVRRLFRRDIRRPQHFVPTAEGIRCGGAVRAGWGGACSRTASPQHVWARARL